MARPLRIQFPGAIYHVNTVGVRRSVIFPDDAAREMFLAILGVAVSRYSWTCGSYCLLDTHYHLLVQTHEANIGRGMQFVNGVYAQWSTGTYRTRGHAFESRYYSVLVESSLQLLRAARYIALNPLAAGMCAHPADWPWSSYPTLVGDARVPRLLTPEFVLDELSDKPNRARDHFRQLVEEAGLPDWPPDATAPEL